MDTNICKRFKKVLEDFPDNLDNKKNYQFKNGNLFKKYCNNNCDGPLDKINAGCLYFFNEFFGSSSSFKNHAKCNINVVEYIMIWLSYMLNLKDNVDGITNLGHFYTTYMNKQENYTNSINGVTEYTNYMDLIDKKKYFLNMNNNIVSNLYKAFNLLCEMYTGFDENKEDCAKYSEKASQFIEIYKKLNENSNNSDGIPYRQALCTLSSDYDNFKKKYNESQRCESSSLPTIEEKNTLNCPEQTVKCSEQTFEAASSSSSIGNKLFLFLSIFGAIAIFLGISYKYSLFGFRKRAQKQKLREKLKK
ncbi:PIR protein [Plasmodium yoelii]|uniref:PIR protein n=2 Tax=Plasmodium yoelii TaxID=5861 RepID=A0AAE9WVU4_PLAYO|nr:PIR protein [Plasmodium yoelii]WBY61353.1 PIR protein [Plasmodium yoelii yoelii]VTZ82007.1 PIR protein [Plasmodium yoelii]|eukprot:XP_022810918.1 PIR protein [Plasmodium yoelii]